MPQHKQLAHILTELTAEILWPEQGRWLGLKGRPLQCRVGGGRATYHRRMGEQHSITYGVRMVADKRCARRAEAWLSAREIRRHGYFAGEFSYAALLAHTCCHEFAHFIQEQLGLRARGSVHNAHFYRLLDEIHSHGLAQRVIEALHLKAQALQLCLSFDEVSEAAAVPSIGTGQRVSFDYKGRLRYGLVTRIHRKTVRVEPENLRQIKYFRVAPQLLTIV